MGRFKEGDAQHSRLFYRCCLIAAKMFASSKIGRGFACVCDGKRRQGLPHGPTSKLFGDSAIQLGTRQIAELLSLYKVTRNSRYLPDPTAERCWSVGRLDRNGVGLEIRGTEFCGKFVGPRFLQVTIHGPLGTSPEPPG